MDLFNKNKIKNLGIEKDELNTKLEAKEIENKCLIDRITDYEKMNADLKEENKKLTEWVKSILSEFGTYDVYGRDKIKIPVWKHQSIKYDPAALTRTYEDIIVIPEIIIHTTKSIREDK